MQSVMQSVAQEYIEKGIQQGIEQGIVTKAREVAKSLLLELHLDIGSVQKVTKLTNEELQELLKEVKINKISK